MAARAVPSPNHSFGLRGGRHSTAALPMCQRLSTGSFTVFSQIFPFFRSPPTNFCRATNLTYPPSSPSLSVRHHAL